MKMDNCAQCGNEIRGDVCEYCLEDVTPASWVDIIYFKKIIPNYDERTLFLIGFISLLIFFTEDKAVSFVAKGINESFYFFLIFMAVLLSAFFNIFHAFTKKKKSKLEKKGMISFAIIMNASTGILAGSYILEKSHGVLVVFPVMNMLNAGILLLLLKLEVINEDNISDENASLLEVLLSGTIALIVFMFSTYKFNNPWFITFSICMAYATNLNGPVISMFEKVTKKPIRAYKTFKWSADTEIFPE